MSCRKIKFIAAALAIIALAACECVPTLDTPKKFDPDEAARLLFVHAMPDVGAVVFESDVITLEDLGYDSPANEYHKLSAGTNHLRIIRKENGANLFLAMAEFEKDLSYTLVAYGAGNGTAIESKILNDTIGSFDQTKTYVRFVNVAAGVGNVNFILRTNDPINFEIEYRRNTDLYPIEPGKYFMDVKNVTDGSIIVSNRLEFEAGKVHSIILRGIKNVNRSPELYLTSADYIPPDE